MTTPSPPSSEQAERILSFWHKVEFFASPDLKELGEDSSSVIQYPHCELETTPDCLPWLNREHLRRASNSHDPDKPYAFKLYLEVFYRSEIFRIAHEIYSESVDGREERNADEGQTCSMTVKVDEYGRLDHNSFEFSTAPWALGEVVQGRLDAMTMQAFEAATQLFKDRLTTIVNVADNVKRAHGLPPMLTTFELIEMLKAMAGWTSFAPKRPDASAMCVQTFEVRGERAKTWQKAQRPCVSAASLHALADKLPMAFQSGVPDRVVQQETSETDSEEEVDTSDEIAILNSFFIRDLERVIRVLKSTGLALGSPLARYLQSGCEKHPDLLLPEGRSLLMQSLAPERMPVGRWPGEDKHSMSLMQQFAINTIDKELKETGLYSVNGPPGTGKTTMLRDLVACNMVKRAEVLASLSSPEAAFGKSINAYIQDEQREIKTLIPALTGFEMVVASSNNAAVENVTQELPRLKALGEAHKGLEYLKSVAQKLAAKHEKKHGKLHVSSLTPEEDCWGLMATALGNSKNRNRFGNRVFFEKIDEKCVAKDEASNYSTLIPALNALAKGGNPKQDFIAAQRAFKEAEKQVQAIYEEIKRLQDIQRLKTHTEAARRQPEFHKRIAARFDLRLKKRQAERVPFWALVARVKKRSAIKQIKLRVSHAEQQAAVSQQRLGSLERRLNDEQQVCASLIEKYDDVLLPDDERDLEAADIQRTSFGHCELLNKARSELTARAFELHEAWFVAAYKGGNNLWSTIKSLMPMINGSVGNRDAAKALWQMLFMIVPVVSSTFASVARQFQMLEEGDIGWLFIDEAGQATPQQAVGALWRAKRAVVVGDPLQIEPVFTVPAPLVEAMAETALGDDWQKWSPTMTSVQVVADRANPYGTCQITGNKLWVGSPLRVHRRCDEPMFSISNAIAYNGKMLHGNPDLVPGSNDSVWIDIDGEVEGRHFVPSQADVVYDLLRNHIQQNPQQPPEFYIISPFKQVANKLKECLEERLSAPCFKDKDELKTWLKSHVGTVHTFQGKEERNVILVLGLSRDNPGAANWASGTPNLLNVALTRAKKRVYVVGSTEIWGSKSYFSEAREQLPSQVTPEKG